MAKKSEKKKNKTESVEEASFSPKAEKTFKIIVRIMSWFVGLVFILILILPELNSPFWDEITRIIFILGIIDLLVVLVIEYFADNIKQLLTRLFDEQST